MPHLARAAALTAAAAVTAALTSCGGGPAAAPSVGATSDSTTPAPPRSTSVPATEVPVAPSTPPPPAEPLTIAFVGDINFEGEIGPRLDADPASVFGPARDLLALADLTIGNLETAIAEGGRPEPKEFTFQAPPSAFDALDLAGFDAVSMANNHGVDFGAGGLDQTLAAIAQTDVAVAGIGADAAGAYAPVFLEAKGRRVAFLAALDLRDNTWRSWGASDTNAGVARFDDRFVEAVRAAEPDADLTIAYIHWAPENEFCPDPDVAPPIVDALVAAGADIVVGAHAHMLQGAGWRGRSFVAYGLGNYLWYFQRVEATTRTGILTVTIDAANDPVAYDYDPARIQTPSGIPLPMEGAEAQDAQRLFEQLRTQPNPFGGSGGSCTDLAAAPSG